MGRSRKVPVLTDIKAAKEGSDELQARRVYQCYVVAGVEVSLVYENSSNSLGFLV